MALGTRYPNPIIETSRANARAVRQFIDAGFADIVYTNSTDAWAGVSFDAAENRWSNAFTATGARTPSIRIPIDGLLPGWTSGAAVDTSRGEVARGFELVGVDVIYQVGTANLTSQTPSLERVVFAHHAASTATDTNMTTTATAANELNTNANPKITAYTLATAVVLAESAGANINIALATPNTCVYTFYGIKIVGTLLL